MCVCVCVCVYVCVLSYVGGFVCVCMKPIFFQIKVYVSF